MTNELDHTKSFPHIIEQARTRTFSLFQPAVPEQATSSDAISPSFNETEAHLAQVMTKLSVEERTHALEDLHGVSPGAVGQGVKAIDLKLVEFDFEISKQKNKTYEKAERLSKEYVENREFRLIFLRYELFDVQKAVKLFMSLLETKLLYFGEEKLTKDITLSDLTEDDMKMLESGAFQELADTDSSGRAVVLLMPLLLLTNSIKSIETTIRALFYFFFCAVGKGFVKIFYNTSPHTVPLTPTVAWKILKMRTAFPFGRDFCIHFCLNVHVQQSRPEIHLLLMNYFSSREQARVKFHVGNDKECQDKLKSFGISMRSFPIDVEGNLSLDNHRKWIQQRRDIERVKNVNPLFPNPDSKTKTAEAFYPSVKPEAKMKRSVSDEDAKQTSCEVLGEGTENATSVTLWGNEHGALQSVFSSTLAESDLRSINIPEGACAKATMPLPQISETRIPLLIDHTSPHTLFNGMGVNFAYPNQIFAPTTQTLLFTNPLPQDVLFGRGLPIQNHPGNVRFREILDQYADDYDNDDLLKKRMVALQVVRRVASSGTRFLKPMDKNLWAEVDDKVAYKKVCQFFRTRRVKKISDTIDHSNN